MIMNIVVEMTNAVLTMVQFGMHGTYESFVALFSLHYSRLKVLFFLFYFAFKVRCGFLE